MDAIVETAIEALKKPLIEEFVKVRLKGIEGQPEYEEAKKTIEEAYTSSKDFARGLKNLASKLTLLTKGTVDFAIMLASIPMAIISATPTGPGVSINLILPLLKQLQGQAKNISSVYDEVETGLDGFQVPELAEENEAIGYAYGLIKRIMTAASTACSIVGVGCGGEEDKEVTVDSPMKVEASECDNYRTDSEHSNTDVYPKDPQYCTKFEAIMTKTIDDFKDDEEGTAQEKLDAWLSENRVCSNCKNYKK